MNIIEAIEDENLFRPFLGDDLTSWEQWQVALRAIYGLPIAKTSRKLIDTCTGRDARYLPASGFNTSLFLTGRRSGKSKTSAVIGAFEAVLAGHERKLSKGEKGIVPICAPSRNQARIVKGYLRSIFEAPSILANQVVNETKDGFELRNGNRIEILAGDWRTVRGYTLIAAIVDEACFFGYDAESKVKSDSELIAAIQPGLATTHGKLICISSPYAKKGYCYEKYKKHYGNDKGKILVWNCASKVMNPSLSQDIIDQAMEEDPHSARAEYGGEFRDDVADYLPLSVIEAVVVKNRLMLIPREKERYYAFADLSGGRNDDAALAIGHKEGERSLVDLIKRYKAPFSPNEVIADMCKVVRPYGVRHVVGDNYAADFVADGFRRHELRYRLCKENKNILYAELIPHICSQKVELLDDPFLVKQLASLERRTRSGGRDVIDHPAKGHDDVANAVAGVVYVMNDRRIQMAKSYVV